MAENKSLVVLIKLSNKLFAFFSNLTSYLSVSELVKMLLQAFSGNPI